MKKRANPLKILILFFLMFYASYTLIRQEVEIKKYDKEKQYYMEQIQLAQVKHEEYKKYSEYVKTDAYIEKIAREKLGMLLPEEKIYIEYSG